MDSGLRKAAVVALAAAVAACGKSPQSGDDASTELTQETPDAGIPDAGPPPLPPIDPVGTHWTFYGPGNGGPSRTYGASMDDGGNLWVAGGEEGLFLLRAGSTRFERFTLADGLHPWGTPFAGQGPVTAYYLNVSAVAGGAKGVVYVGYLGMPPPAGQPACEDNWDAAANPDPNVYKSGDADKVILLPGGGIKVLHYDLSTPPGHVAAEPRGREKLCHVYRILFDRAHNNLWFGANHGYAWGNPDFDGYNLGAQEHAHPLLNGYPTETATGEYAYTNYYWGLTVEPNGWLWVGGKYRSQHCPGGINGSGFWTCEAQGSNPANQVDWWPDKVHVDSRPSQRLNDDVSGMALGPDGDLYIGSFTLGLAHQKSDGSLEYITKGLANNTELTSMAADPYDGSVWVGHLWGGITRIRRDQFVLYGGNALGGREGSAIPDIQIDQSQPFRRVIVTFRGSVGIYDGR